MKTKAISDESLKKPMGYPRINIAIANICNKFYILCEPRTCDGEIFISRLYTFEKQH